MRRRRAWAARSADAALPALLVAFLVLPPASADPGPQAADAVLGRWWVEGGAAQVEIAPCGPRLCGRVVWLRHPLGPEGCALRDAENPDPTLRRRPVLGLRILWDLQPEGAGRFEGGAIYDPQSGRTYAARARLDGPDRLRVRGYLGLSLLGRTSTWLRVGAEAACTEASS